MRWIAVVGSLALGCTRAAPQPAPRPAPGPVAPVATCAAQVVRAPGAGAGYADWRAAWSALRGDGGGAPPATEAEARARLCGAAGCPGSGPWLIEQLWDDYPLPVRTDLVFQRATGDLVVEPEVGLGLAGRCPWSDRTTLTIDATGAVHLRVDHDDVTAEYAHVSDTAITRCEPGADACEEACFVAAVAAIDRWFDRGSGFELLAIERRAAAPATPERLWLDDDYRFATELAITDVSAIVTGPGCGGPVPIPQIRVTGNAACPGDSDGIVNDEHEQPRCRPDEHDRAAGGGRPLCVPTAPCLFDRPGP